MNAAALILHSDSVNPQQPIYNPTISFKNPPSAEFEFDATRISAVRLERLYEEQALLIEQRNALLDKTMSLTPEQQDQLDNIDKRLDVVEADIEQMSSRRYHLDVHTIASMIEDNELWIQNMIQKVRSKK
jgi:hypothetical protein